MPKEVISLHKRILNAIRLSMMIMLLVLSMIITSSTFAAWIYGVEDAEGSSLGSIGIGAWTQAPTGVDAYSDTQAYYPGDLVWFEGEFYVYHGNYTLGNEPTIANNWTHLNDLNWYSNIIYHDGDVVFYNEIVYQAHGYNSGVDPSSGGTNNPWDNKKNNIVSWQPGNATTLNEVVYHEDQLWVFKKYYTTSEPGSTNEWALKGDLTFSTNHVYENGDIVYYSGTYYTTSNGGWATGTTPGSPYGPWTEVSVPGWSGSIPNGTEYVSYNSLIYKALVTNISTLRNTTPGSSGSKGIWTAIDTQQWQQYNTYALDELIMYNDNVYMLANTANSTDIPGTQPNSWDLMETMQYDPYNTYAVGEFAVISDIVYIVVNATNANSHAPGTYANAWNRLSDYDWYWYNVYSTGDVVYHSDGVYVALSGSTNVEPGMAGSESYWGLYNEN
jgi:hypothetical protein